jgi:hypothetical protein
VTGYEPTGLPQLQHSAASELQDIQLSCVVTRTNSTAAATRDALLLLLSASPHHQLTQSTPLQYFKISFEAL